MLLNSLLFAQIATGLRGNVADYTGQGIVVSDV
jgi:hypothetical protein